MRIPHFKILLEYLVVHVFLDQRHWSQALVSLLYVRQSA